jgi:hypothetical protein
MTGKEREALEAVASAIRNAQEGFVQDPSVMAEILEAGDVADYLAREAVNAYRTALAVREKQQEPAGETLTIEEREGIEAAIPSSAAGASRWVFEGGWCAARRFYLAARGEESITVWTCMSCGQIGDAQSCGNCGHEAMPGRWLEAESVEHQLKDAWQQRDDARTILIDSEALATREEPFEPSEGQIEEAARLIYGGVGPTKVCPWERLDGPSKLKWRGVAQVVLRGAITAREEPLLTDAEALRELGAEKAAADAIREADDA